MGLFMSEIKNLISECDNICETFEIIAAQTGAVVKALKEASNEPNQIRKISKLFSATLVAQLCGDKSTTWVRDNVKSGRFPCAAAEESRKNTPKNIRYAFTESEISTILNCVNRKNELCLRIKKALVVTFSQYKGGVGKSTASISFATMQALRGRRILFIDLDAQCSATEWLWADDLDAYTNLSEKETIYEVFVNNDEDYIKSVIKKSAFTNLDFIPSGISVSTLDNLVTGTITESSRMEYWSILNKRLESIKDDYDLIVIDCPPAINILNVNAVWASDLLVSPVSSSMLDVAALNKFAKNMEETTDQIAKIVGIDNMPNPVTRLLVTNFDGNPEADPKQKQQTSTGSKRLKLDDSVVRLYLNRMLPGFMLDTPMVRCEAFKIASNNYKSVVEMDITELEEDGETRKYPLSRSAYNRAFDCITDFCNELDKDIISLIEKQEASHAYR
jgi:cellulose biosynthesis protein BcsQ